LGVWLPEPAGNALPGFLAMIAGDDFVALAEKRLAESRDRMKDYRSLKNSFVPGSVERERASILLEQIEVLHQAMDRLCCQLRLRR
jgi:hypothetical protein